MQVATVMSIVGEMTVGRSAKAVSGKPRSAHLTAPVIASLIDLVIDLVDVRRKLRRPIGPGVRRPAARALSARTVVRSISSIAIAAVGARVHSGPASTAVGRAAVALARLAAAMAAVVLEGAGGAAAVLEEAGDVEAGDAVAELF